jgi:hypothetical protein
MHRTPEGQPDVLSRPRPSRWAAFRAACWDRLRPAARPSRVQRLLFLDDDPCRAEIFLEDHPDAVWVTTVPECLARLAEPWDEVHLDHDLGGKLFVDSQDADCGMEVIRWLCKEPRSHLSNARFFVHTHNSTAGLLMVLHMRASGYKAEFRPFGLELEKVLAHNELAASEETEPPSKAPSGPVGWLLSACRRWFARAGGVAGRVGERN